MTRQIKDVIQNLQDIHLSDSNVQIIMDFERVIDELGIYVFRNWIKGELVEGPKNEKYFVECTFMWPYKLMPDPAGAQRLLSYECEVIYKKDILEYPIQVQSPDDFEAGTRIAKIKKSPIWLVTVRMPKDLLSEIQQGSLEIEGEVYDLETIDQAYEDDLDDQQNNEEPQDQNTKPVSPTNAMGL